MSDLEDEDMDHHDIAAMGAAASDDDSDDESDDDDDAAAASPTLMVPAAPHIPQKEPRTSSPMDAGDDSDDSSDDNMSDANDDSDSDDSIIAMPPKIGMKEPRGKPEAMAVALAAARKQAAREQLEAEKDVSASVLAAGTTGTGDVDLSSPPKADAAPKKKRKSPSSSSKKSASASSGTKKKKTSATSTTSTSKKASPMSKKSSTKKKSSSSSANLSSSSPPSGGSSSSQRNSNRSELLLHEPTVPITNAEYENLELLMIQFCRVPLLAEFSRPVALLHPEVCLFCACEYIGSNVCNIIIKCVIFCICFKPLSHTHHFKFSPLSLPPSSHPVMPRLSSGPSILVMFVAAFVVDPIAIRVTCVSTCGASLAIVSIFIRIRIIKKPFRHSFPLPCICANTSTRSGKNTCCRPTCRSHPDRQTRHY
jgi:hypothetical protein